MQIEKQKSTASWPQNAFIQKNVRTHALTDGQPENVMSAMKSPKSRQQHPPPLYAYRLMSDNYAHDKKGKVFPYSLPSVGPGADPGVQAVSPQVT